jgi:diguanylate cyclase (GGDEF)-like protein/PAS domain S-box-containing protein
VVPAEPIEGLIAASTTTALALLTVDADGDVCAVSRAAADLLADDPGDAVRSWCRSALSAGGRTQGEFHVVRRDGRRLHLGATAVVVHGDQGEPGGLLVTLTDAGALAEASGALHDATHQMEVLRSLPTPVMVAVDGAVVFANPAAFEMIGVHDLEQLSSRIASFAHVHDADHRRVRDRVAAPELGSMAVGESDQRIVRPDGTERVVVWTTLEVDIGGRPALVYALVDQTEILTAHDTVAAAEAQQRQIIDALAEGVLVVDHRGVGIDANHAAAVLLGMPSMDFLVGFPAEHLPIVDEHGATLDRAAHPVWRALERDEYVHDEVVRLRLGVDQIRALRMSVHPIHVYGQASATSAVLTFADVTDELANAAAVEESEARFRRLAALSPVGICETDALGRCTYTNRRWREFTGLDEDESLGRGWVSSVHPADLADVVPALRQAVESVRPVALEFRFLRPDGTSVHVHVEAAPVTDHDERVTGWLGTATDVSLQVSLRAELEAREVRFRQLAERSPDVVMRVDLHPLRFDYIGPAITAITGDAPDAFYADSGVFLDRVHPDDAERVGAELFGAEPGELHQFRVVHRDGSVRTLEVRTHVVRDGAGSAVAIEATARDVSASVEQRRHLDSLAHRDALTGLLNRRALLDELGARLAGGAPTAVLFCDLDGFKAVNDECGHDAGDRVLITIADRLGSSVRERDGDLVARLAGDEFVVVTDPLAAAQVAERLVMRLSQPIDLGDGTTVQVGASVGVARLDPRDGAAIDPADLLRQADTAMYTAKRAGKGRVVHA